MNAQSLALPIRRRVPFRTFMHEPMKLMRDREKEIDRMEYSVNLTQW
jgi:hypothetical protein